MKEAIPGTDEYWKQQKEAISLIKDLRKALVIAEREPQYLGSGMNEEGEVTEIDEYIYPWDNACKIEKQVIQHPRARGILLAYKFKINETSALPLRTAEGIAPASWDIPTFGEEKKPISRPR